MQEISTTVSVQALQYFDSTAVRESSSWTVELNHRIEQVQSAAQVVCILLMCTTVNYASGENVSVGFYPQLEVLSIPVKLSTNGDFGNELAFTLLLINENKYL